MMVAYFSEMGWFNHRPSLSQASTLMMELQDLSLSLVGQTSEEKNQRKGQKGVAWRDDTGSKN